ncbi:MAG: hypothetical protein HWE10_10545 [Gammaproteobacteria bacterium]|nr:hypothetical protein [Gammaproteobacteria bacterium]
MNQLIGLLLTILTLALAALLVVPIELFFHPYALLLVIGCVFGVMFLSYGSHAFAIFKYASQPLKNQKEYFWVISFFDNLSNTAILTGAVGTIMAHTLTLNQIASASGLLSISGQNILPIVYGYALAKLVFEPLKQNVLRKAIVANVNENIQKQIEHNNYIAKRLNLVAISVFILSCLLLLA